MPRANDAAAAMLEEFAELLALSEGDAFKVRAYEKAAQSVGGFPVDVTEMDEHDLDAIPGVGTHIAEKIVELVRTGSVAELDELRAVVPAGLRDLLDVPGLGPKRARQVYDALGVTSRTELLDALHHHRLRDLPGWGERSEEKLAEAIEEAHRAGGRIRLDVALAQAEEILEALRAVPAVLEAECAGSLRRMCPTVGDIDLLVASTDPVPVMAALVALPTVARVIERGETRTSVVTTRGVQVDLRVIEPAVWGSALVYFTGSKSHNIHLREIAVRAGRSLSEYGLVDGATGRVLAAATEEDVYRAFGLPLIPPTLREDTGEIEAGLAGTLPEVVGPGDLRGDLHTHTSLTDGTATLEEMVAAARARGYRYLAVTDHAPLLRMQRMTLEKALDQRARLRRLEAEGSMALLHGTELNIQPDGSLDWPDDVLAGFDVVVACVHSAFSQSRAEMTARILRAVENPHVNVLGHPTGRSIGRRGPVDADWDAVFAAAARTGTALEVNGSPDRLDLDGELVRRALAAGARLALSSDAHAVRHLDNARFAVATAQRGWARPRDVVDAWPLARLRRYLDKHPPRRR